MPPQLLFDLSQAALTGKPVFDQQDILEVNPQCFEMQQLDGILWYDKEKGLILGFKDVTDHEFWVRGHIPGRPLMPGVVMVESAAQLLSFFVKKIYGIQGFVGFGGIESTKFRLQVTPGQRLYLLGHLTEKRPRRCTADVQGVVDGSMVFETTVSGLIV
jgi:3-hydroxyacyl-[acyl-carrier-protein] dehydratase